MSAGQNTELVLRYEEPPEAYPQLFTFDYSGLMRKDSHVTIFRYVGGQQ
jgi:hypothetical protein